jgi:uncharacterized protein (DUF1501 family)
MTAINQSRRHFLRTASALSTMVPAAGSGLALNLATIGAAAAQSAPSDYKALVCVFLYGGCDYANTVLATDPGSWAGYLAARNVAPDPIALDLPGAGTARAVLPLAHSNAAGLNGGREIAVHPNLAQFQSLFDAGRGAVIGNVGPLVVPLTKAQYRDKAVPKPPALFSHNDQQSTWMAFAPEGARVGWGGRMGDLFASSNGDPVFTCISASGNSVFLSGEQTLQYQVGGNGPIGINGINGSVFGNGGASAALRAIVTESRSHLIEKELNRITSRSISAGQRMTDAMALTPSTGLPALPGANAGLASQLRTVARIIGGRSMTNARRQVFMVGIGGFDTHDGLNGSLVNLMQTLSNGFAWFDSAMAQLGLQDNVTTFTASDFGRTLTSNGDGSDHGWGAHHYVVGGAVRGKDVYGRFPIIGVDTSDDVGQGRLLPGVSVDQYAATLGKWFGLSDNQLLDVMPNLANFSVRDLDFMR